MSEDLQIALKFYLDSIKAVRYWKGMAEEAQRTAVQRSRDYSVALEQKEAALADLVQLAEEAK